MVTNVHVVHVHVFHVFTIHFEPPIRGQPLYKRYYAWSQGVLYMEVPYCIQSICVNLILILNVFNCSLRKKRIHQLRTLLRILLRMTLNQSLSKEDDQRKLLEQRGYVVQG